MRGPLTAMRFALAKSARSANATAAAVLAEETARLEEMAREFSEFGRLPEGPEADIDVGDLVRSAVAATVPAAMAVHVDVPAGVLVRGHYEPLRRAVQNLLQNAVDATDRRGVVVTVGCDDGWVRLTVRDYGPGVPTEVRNRAFDPYFTTKDSGTGLGLALARQTVLLHGGSIDIDNAEDGGAVFQLRLRRTT
jgi:two-component system NtrC family sensor kinase